MKIKSIVFLMAAAVVFAGCSAKPLAWETNYDEALAKAQEKNKNLFLFFSGMEWDGQSQQFKTDVLDSAKFINGAKNDFIFVNIDFPADAEALPPEEMEKKYQIAQSFGIQGTPVTVLLDKNGTAFAQIPYEPEAKTGDYANNVKKELKNEKERVSLKKQVEKAAGIQKVKLIDKLFEATQPEYRDSLTELIAQVPELDPENKTGLLGKYKLQLLYPQAIMMYSFGDPVGAAQLFIDFTESGLGASADLQQAFYMAAYLNAVSGAQPDTIISLLQKALDADPKSESAEPIKSTIEQLRTQQGAAQ